MTCMSRFFKNVFYSANQQFDKLWEESQKSKSELNAKRIGLSSAVQIINNGEDSIFSLGINLSKQFPKFKPDGEVHANHFLRFFFFFFFSPRSFPCT